MGQMGPWNRYKDAQDADGLVPEQVLPQEEKKVEDKKEGVAQVIIKTRAKVPSQFQISKGDEEKHGITRLPQVQFSVED